MTLDEAIKYHEEIAEEHSKYANNSLTLESDRLHFKNSVNEHRQLAEWLKELKQLREDKSTDKQIEDLIEELESRKEYGVEYAQAMEDVIVILKSKFGIGEENG